MLDGVSCWYFDWATVGTWVGGLGAAAAACAAVWAVLHGECERAEFAKYLFNKDLARLEELLGLYETLPIFLNFYDHAFEDQREEGVRLAEGVMTRASMLASQFEYFGHSEQQFRYRPKCDRFSELARQAANAAHFEGMTKRLLLAMGTKRPAMEHSTEMGRMLKESIDAWKVGQAGRTVK